MISLFSVNPRLDLVSKVIHLLAIMSLRCTVKVSHLSNLSDARFCSGMGVQLLGFGVIPGTEHYLPPQVFQELRGWLAGPKIIAELYGVSSDKEISDVIQAYAPDYLELTWSEYTKFRPHLTLPCVIQLERNIPSDLLSEKHSIPFVIVPHDCICNDISQLPYPSLIRVRSTKELQARLDEGCVKGFVLDAPLQTKAGLTSYDELGEMLEALDDEA